MSIDDCLYVNAMH